MTPKRDLLTSTQFAIATTSWLASTAIAAAKNDAERLGKLFELYTYPNDLVVSCAAKAGKTPT